MPFTELDLVNMRVKELRALNLKKNIFPLKPIIRLKKDIINKIMESEWFKKQDRGTRSKLKTQKDLDEKLARLEAKLDAKKSGTDSGTMLTHRSDGKLDIGHTVVNVYVGNSKHPNFPVPVSVVRQALDAQNLSPKDHAKVSKSLKKLAKESTPIQGIPQRMIPEAVPHKSHSKPKFRKRFPAVGLRAKQKIKPPSRPDNVSTPKPAAAEPAEGKTETAREKLQRERREELEKPAEVFVEPETRLEKERRERREDIAFEIAKGKRQKGSTDSIKSKLAAIFGAKLAAKKPTVTPVAKPATEAPVSANVPKAPELKPLV